MYNSLVVVYKKKNYKIPSCGKEFIVWNTRLDFHEHHTHISNYNTCKYIVNLCIKNRIPDKHLSSYLLNSILRISDNEDFKCKIKSKIKGGLNNGRET